MAYRRLLSVMWSGGGLGGKWLNPFAVHLFPWNYHSIVNQLYFNTKKKKDSNRTQFYFDFQNQEQFITNEISFKDKNNSTQRVLFRWFSESQSS